MESDAQTISTIGARVDAMGFGRYQIMVLLAVGGSMFSESIEMGSMEPLTAAIDTAFSLPLSARAVLPAMVYAGSAVGLVVAGPLCDHWGRRGSLIAANCFIVLAQVSTACWPVAFGYHGLMVFRFLAGFASGFGAPASSVLAVESTPAAHRAAMLYAGGAMAAVGYLFSALGVGLFMPDFGEAGTDSYRGFVIFTAIPAALCMPLIILFISESPAFYAGCGDADGCTKALSHIAEANGCTIPSQPIVCQQRSAVWSDVMLRKKKDLYNLFFFHSATLLSVCWVDAARTFFMAGSAYMWPQLFAMSSGQMSPTSLNIYASLAPLVGIGIGLNVTWLDSKRVMFGTSVMAAAAVITLMNKYIRTSGFMLFMCVMWAKLCYGPFATVINLMKTEYFPTRVRGTAYAFISCVAKVGSVTAPSMAELVKRDGWLQNSIVVYLEALAIAILSCGMVSLIVPTAACDLDETLGADKTGRIVFGAGPMTPSYGAQDDTEEVRAGPSSSHEPYAPAPRVAW